MAGTKSFRAGSAPGEDKGHFAIALGVGLLLELGGLALLLPAMAHRESPATTPAPIRISIVAPAPAPTPPPKPTPVPVRPVVPVPPPPPLPVAPQIPMPPPPPMPAAHHVTQHYVKPRPRLQPPAPVTPVRPPPVAVTPPVPAQPPAPPAPTGGQVDLFSAAIKRALQAHANQVYPPAAQMAQQAGSPELTFTYLNGVVTNISLTRSCGFPLLDRAALQDAQIASYPPPPQGFAGRTYHITVTVTFQLAAPTVDGD